ncbi:MAG: DUF3089 domain-containing protein [Jatrophihabitantaceae bacterium]
MIAVLAAGCGSHPHTSSAPTSNVLDQQADAAGTVWLCRPGRAEDPCDAPLPATVVPANGPRTIGQGHANAGSAFDCFYVYPTVSTQPSDNATLQVQPAETDVAIAQASRFSQVCRVWAPMYRQRTDESLLKGLGGDPRADSIAYASLLAAWRDYLAHDNDGRPVIFIGHSQGAAMLSRLLAGQVDPDPALRAKAVVAILAGGNVTVPAGRSVGATFTHLPLCTAPAQTGCVIAYSTFPTQPPRKAEVGRPGQGVSLQSGQTATGGMQIACVNPAALGGGTATLEPYFRAATSTVPPPPLTTGWVTYPNLYSATCHSADDAGWLQVDTLTTAGRPVVAESLGPTWGYHAEDINLALGNLVTDVSSAEAGYTAHHP